MGTKRKPAKPKPVLVDVGTSKAHRRAPHRRQGTNVQRSKPLRISKHQRHAPSCQCAQCRRRRAAA